jgi:hypothetical protein
MRRYCRESRVEGRESRVEGMLYFSLPLRLCASAPLREFNFQQPPTPTSEESELYYLPTFPLPTFPLFTALRLLASRLSEDIEEAEMVN